MTAGTEHDRELDSDLVSIIMPTYNCGAFIAETIATVQAQTHPRWELIVVDDCSTDDTTEVVGALAKDDPRIRYVRLETNSGAAMARNRAMELAQGRYMAFLDSDDLWHPDKLRRQIDFMTSRDVAMSCTAYAQIDEQGVPTGRIVRSPARISYNRLLLDCQVATPPSCTTWRAWASSRFPTSASATTTPCGCACSAPSPTSGGCRWCS